VVISRLLWLLVRAGASGAGGAGGAGGVVSGEEVGTCVRGRAQLYPARLHAKNWQICSFTRRQSHTDDGRVRCE
jgi:hypothetical protein